MSMRMIGIVGNAADKFTRLGIWRAKRLIHQLLDPPHGVTLVSGHCHLGGVDIWAEEACDTLGIPKQIFAPRTLRWSGPGGFKMRNMGIAYASDTLHVIVADRYPPSFTGPRWTECYHCHSRDHVKSGGCWTGLAAQRMGRTVIWHTIHNGV